MGYISLSSGWNEINLLWVFLPNVKKTVWVNQKRNRFCSSTDSATLLAVDKNSFPAMLNKTKTYFSERYEIKISNLWLRNEPELQMVRYW